MSFNTYDELVRDKRIKSFGRYIIDNDVVVENIDSYFKDNYFWVIIGMIVGHEGELFIVRFDEFLFIIAALEKKLYYSEYFPTNFPFKRKICFTQKDCRYGLLTKIIIKETEYRTTTLEKHFMPKVIDKLIELKSEIEIDLENHNKDLFEIMKELPWREGLNDETNPTITTRALDFGDILRIYSLNVSKTCNLYTYFKNEDIWVGIDYYCDEDRTHLFVLRFDEFLFMIGDLERKLYSSCYVTPELDREISIRQFYCKGLCTKIFITANYSTIDEQGLLTRHIEKLISLKSQILEDLKDYNMAHYSSFISDFPWSESAKDEEKSAD